MALVGTTEIGMKATGTKADVPNDPRARLMYYLSCICNVLDIKDDPKINRLKNYANYKNLSRDDTIELMQFCLMVGPDVLEGKCIFHDDDMCKDSGNEFYQIEAVKNTFLVAGNVMIGGRQRQVKTIMTYKRVWLQNNYSEPMERLQKRGCAIL